MEFDLNCSCLDGLVLIDRGFIKELNNELNYDLLCSFEILLDHKGTSELICDFPDEDWGVVWARESAPIQAFCNQGKMIVWLLDGVKTECVFEKDDTITDSDKWLSVPTGSLLAVTAGEFLQCLFYPELEMEELFTITIPAGWYAIKNNGIEEIKYCMGNPFVTAFHNIQGL